MYIAKKGPRGRPKNINPNELPVKKVLIRRYDYLLYLYQQGIITLPMLKAGELYRERYDSIFFDSPKVLKFSVLNKIGMESLRSRGRGSVPKESPKDISRYLQWQRLRTCIKRKIGDHITFLDDMLLYEPMSFPFIVERMPPEIKRVIQKGLQSIHLNIK